MLDCISVENMRLSDAMTIEKYVPSLELMRRAADGVFQATQWHGKVAIVVGSGNNGGDGFALACILRQSDIDCAVFAVSQRQSADSTYYAAKATELDVPIMPFVPGCLDGFDMVVDCLLGTGFQGGFA
jgi:NAD(P)H-hydrate epimerase